MINTQHWFTIPYLVQKRHNHVKFRKHIYLRSGILSRTSPRTEGRRSARWRMPWINPSSQPFSRDPPQKSRHEGSPTCQSSMQGWRLQTWLCHPGRPGHPHVSSRDTWLQLSTSGQGSKPGITPCSAGGTRKDLVLSRAGRGNGSGGGHGGIPCIGCPLDEMGNQDGGLDHRVAVQG